jgi:hypothetical protein
MITPSVTGQRSKSVSHSIPSWVSCCFFYIYEWFIWVYKQKIYSYLFADDTSILFTHSNTTKFNANTHAAFESINISFKHNYLSLNFWKNLLCSTLSCPYLCTDDTISYKSLAYALYMLTLLHSLSYTLTGSTDTLCKQGQQNMCRDVNIRLKSGVLYVT